MEGGRTGGATEQPPSTGGVPAQSGRAESAAPGADDPELVAVRAYAAELVLAAGGIPHASGYRPRLEPGRRPSVPLHLPSARLFSAFPRPTRAVVFAALGLGAVAGVLLLRGSFLPDSSLDLAGPLPGSTGTVPTLTPPPAPPPSSFPAPAAKADPEVARVDAPPRVAPAPAAAAVQRHRGRSKEPALASGGGPKVSQDPPWSTGRPRKQESSASLDRRAIVTGMHGIEPLVKQCYREHRQKGVATLSVQVSEAGRVTRVGISGPLARTRTAACLKAAVKAARFHGGGINFQYPLFLP
jgi:hypothetical protein